jgi:short-subunit dehydrogenase
VALVTGASSGIGYATARLLVQAGFRVFGTTRKQAAERLEGFEVLQLDVRSEESVSSCVSTVLEKAGRIDALVNNAGFALIGAAEETSLEEAKELFDTNFFGVLRTTQAVLPVMRQQRAGRIVVVGSVAGFLPGPYESIYAASKHALEGLVESLDHEVRQFGIRVAVIEPGFIRTKIAQNSQVARNLIDAYKNDRDRVRAAIENSVANGEDPAQVASVIHDAITDTSPRTRYPAGSQARFLSRVIRFAPRGVLERGLRKQFGLDVA